jgi:hypothetical protein
MLNEEDTIKAIKLILLWFGLGLLVLMCEGIEP